MTDTPGSPSGLAPAASEPVPTIGGFTPEQTRQLADMAVQDRKLTREQADAMLKADGIEPAPAAIAPTDDADQNDFGGVPTDSIGYRFPRPIGGRIDPATDREAREVFHAAHVPHGIATQLATRWNALAATPQTAQQAEAALQINEAKLQNQWGENYRTKMGNIRKLFDSMPETHRARGLKMFDALNGDPIAMNWLSALAEARARRRG